MNKLLLFLLVGCLELDPARPHGSSPGLFVGHFDPDPCSQDPCDHICTRFLFSYKCSCRPGFLLSDKDKKTCIPINAGKCDPGYEPSSSSPSQCVDINECAQKVSPCGQICTNYDGSYECSCKTGFVLSDNDYKTCLPIGSKCDQGFEPSKSDPSKCVDIDECAQQPSPCGHTCTNYEGSYECSCRSGYILSDNDYKTCLPSVSGCDQGYEPSKSDPSKCVDLNECAQKVPPCGQICTNYEGSYECSCKPGFTLSEKDYKSCLPTTNTCDQGFEPSKSDPSKCVDINECEKKKPCGQICTNYEGSYECSCNHQFTLSDEDYSTCIPNKCDDGFERSKSDPTKCVDIDECARNKKPCEQICTNYEGSYECSCRPGFTLSDKDYKSCHQVDNCKSKPCEQICESVETSYKCSCREGYVVNKSDPKKCEVVDFCKNKPCQHTCTSTPKGYSCSCKEGFQISKSDPTKCEAIDFCKDKPCEQMCTSTTKTYKCSCKEGFQISKSDPKKCEAVAVDYCKSKPCQQVCTSTSSSFKCSCNQGFEISKTDPTKCEAIDFCKSKPCQQVCTSTSSSFKCSCNQGFEISKTNPTKCEATDQCKSKPCEQVCTSSATGFKCSCNEGFVVSKSDPNKCEAIGSCKADSCAHICTNSSTGFKCSCKEGYTINSKDSTKCDDIDECATKKPCQQNCKNVDGGYKCSCKEGWEVDSKDFTKCSEIKICNKPVDIIFVIDSSASVGTTSNKIQLQFASNIAKHFTVGPNNALFGALLFGNNPSKLFDLKNYTTSDQVSQKILNAPYLREQSTGTDKALKFITNEKMFSAENGGRPNVPDFVVVLTDGKSTNSQLTANEAKNLKSSNAQLIAVGIGKDANKSELETIASDKDSVYLVPDFDSLNYIEQALSKITCPAGH